jgi:ketosteroid isomerase-like protein
VAGRPDVHPIERKTIMKALLAPCLLALAGLVSLPAHAAPADEAGIREVVASFGQAIIKRDKPAFLKLFLSPDVTWQSVLSDASLARLKEKKPEAVKAKYREDRNAVSFIDGIVASEKSSEETFDNVRIDTDGDVAVVTFDYAFLADGQKTNWGKECWLLVRTEDGWKITTLAYSIVTPASGT